MIKRAFEIPYFAHPWQHGTFGRTDRTTRKIIPWSDSLFFISPFDPKLPHHFHVPRETYMATLNFSYLNVLAQ